MLYEYIIENYKTAEPIFFSDIEIQGISKSALSQQLKTLCKNELLVKYENGVYYLPKKSQMKSQVGLTADIVAKYRYISRDGRLEGFYAGNSFANQIGISAQVPRMVEIVTNNTGSSAREVEIGGRKFYIRKSIETITNDNVYVLQLLDLLKYLEKYLDGTYQEAKEKFAEFIEFHNIKRADVDRYIRKFPDHIFRNYYELGLDTILIC